MRATNGGLVTSVRKANPPRSFPQPLGDQRKDLLTVLVVEWLMVSAVEHPQLALRRRGGLQPPAALGIDQTVGGPGQDHKSNRDFACPCDGFSTFMLPLRVQATRGL